MATTEIEKLTAEVKALREVLQSIASDAAFYRTGETDTPPLPGIDDTAIDEKTAPQPAAPPDEPVDDTPDTEANGKGEAPADDEAVTRQGISQMCLSMIRSKTATKEQLLAVMGRYNATTLKEVADDQLSSLSVEIKNIGKGE